MKSILALVLPLVLASCTEYELGEQDDEKGWERFEDTSWNPIEDTEEPPDTEVDTGDPEPPDCEVALATEREIEVLEECEGSGWSGTVTDPWDVAIEWQWTGLASNPSVHNSITTPVVANLTDDNGDGQVNEQDTPDVVTLAFISSSFSQGYLVVLDGATGNEIWNSPGYNGVGGPALADLDSDGVTDIVVFDSSNHVEAVDANGIVMWTSSATSSASYPQATVADLDGDGTPEVIADNLILDGLTGALIATLNVGGIPYYMPAVGDIDLDGDQEVILGNKVFSRTGATEWSSNITGTYGHWSAILEYDGDPEAEVAMIGGGQFALYEHNGVLIHQVTAGTGQPGPPCVADFDGDGEAEIAWASSGVFNLYELDGTSVWSQSIDDSSGLAACSGYDIDGDGAYEVLYADQATFYIFDGTTGTLRFSQGGHASGTLWEYPSVADIDNDGSAEVLFSSNNYWMSGWGGITAMGHNGDGWPKSGTTWHVHDFAVSNINPDGTVPANPDPPWQKYNVYRARPAVDDPASSDLLVTVYDLCVASCDPITGNVKISVQVQNQGGDDVASGTPWALYRIDGSLQTLVQSGVVPEQPTGMATVGWVIEVSPVDMGTDGFAITIDDDGTGVSTVSECDESNNTHLWLDRICQ